MTARICAPAEEMELARATVERFAAGSRPWFMLLVRYAPPEPTLMMEGDAIRAFATSSREIWEATSGVGGVERTFRATTLALEEVDCDIYARQMPPRSTGSTPIASTSVAWVIPHAGEMGLLDQALARAVRSDSHSLHVVFDQVASGARDVLVSRYPRVEFSETRPHGVGPYVARNAVAHLSAADVLAFQDSDDVPCADRLRAQLATMERTGCDIVGCHAISLDLLERAVFPQRFPLDVSAALRGKLRFPILFPTIVAKRAAVLRAGGFSTVRTFSGDTQFLLRAHFTSTIANADEFLYVRRRRPGSLTTDPSTGLGSRGRSEVEAPWLADFDAVRDGRMSLDESSLAVEHREPRAQIVPLR